jgi:hypothetical protein
MGYNLVIKELRKAIKMSENEQPESSGGNLFVLPSLPTSNDKLFDQHGDWWNNACLNWCHDTWTIYAYGYKEAADMIVGTLEVQRGPRDALVYPVLFLYRQYIELQLKDTIRLARIWLNLGSDFPKTHRIDELWKELHRYLMTISPDDSPDTLIEIGRLVDEFAKVDPLSMAFRYPEDKAGAKSLPGIERINLRNVREVIGKMSIILEGANIQLDEYLQCRFEQEQEFSGDW